MNMEGNARGRSRGGGERCEDCEKITRAKDCTSPEPQNPHNVPGSGLANSGSRPQGHDADGRSGVCLRAGRDDAECSRFFRR